MADIEKAFTFLQDNIPSWCNNLSEIEDKVTGMQNAIARVPMSRPFPLRKKTGSVESIRDLDAILEEPCSSTAAQSSPLANRKRKTPSALSGHASGPSKYRTRTMIIVHYDGQIQKAFETLVRNIGTGRNMLRKGKMAAKMEALAELAGSDDDDDDEEDPVMSKIGYRRRAGLSSLRARATMRGMGGPNDNSASPELFDTTDKALEQAQGLCEKAAHQSLRDGDCRKELSGVRRYFQEVLEKAAQETAKYKARKEQEAATEGLRTETPSATKIEPKPATPTVQSIPPVPATSSKTTDIEVDDDDDDDLDFVMPPIRLTSRA
ncbi:uncharacterized protein BDR25DRAFT_302001 [Lindgomyces ingoldianus]|uniref:Uncharacterized protein n=1 Tax=Lindgomyces ingoldianus TaxID=673940 RepID=A0ACB6R4F4_9PLEO|nr:uncharacterized protein BDR25DRAFT_302001 [Lindgomyces ingoldianus]KAF2473942.1 hypothetical protein BDR25DRAFT_302001 [Lindgomyces ingoldianus]